MFHNNLCAEIYEEYEMFYLGKALDHNNRLIFLYTRKWKNNKRSGFNMMSYTNNNKDNN